MKKRLRYRIYPNKKQIDFLNKTFNGSRFIWNVLLAKGINDHMAYSNGLQERPSTNQYHLINLVVPIKQSNPWLYDIPSKALQQSAKDLSDAFRYFFRSNGFPSFKKSKSRQSFRLVDNGFDIRKHMLKIGNLPTPIKVNFHKPLPSEPSSVTIIKEPDGKYYASFVCEVDPILTNGQDKIGIDLGIKDFCTFSTGEKIANPKFLEKNEKKLAKLQRQLAKKQKGSNNRNKARLKVAKQHSKIKNQRNDFLHKLSRKLVNENQVIALESLNIKGMVRNRHLSKSISSVSWGRFIQLLLQKACESQHCSIVRVSPWFASTQTCNHCQRKCEGKDKISLSVRTWQCKYCQTKHDRDINAAKNILTESLKILEPKLLELHYPNIALDIYAA